MNDWEINLDPALHLPQDVCTHQYFRLITAAWVFGWIGLIALVCGQYIPFAAAACSAAACVMWAGFEREYPSVTREG